MFRSAAPLLRTAVRASAQLQRGFADAPMPLTFACPTTVFYNASNVKQIDVPSQSGAFGILPNHVPVLASLQPGVVTVTEESGDMKKYFVSSGSITVNEDSSVQVLAEEACPVQELDVAAAREGFNAAQTELGSATSETAKAEAQIKMEVYDALLKAAESAAAAH